MFERSSSLSFINSMCAAGLWKNDDQTGNCRGECLPSWYVNGAKNVDAGGSPGTIDSRKVRALPQKGSIWPDSWLIINPFPCRIRSRESEAIIHQAMIIWDRVACPLAKQISPSAPVGAPRLNLGGDMGERGWSSASVGLGRAVHAEILSDDLASRKYASPPARSDPSRRR
jgi:hypothetical protein